MIDFDQLLSSREEIENILKDLRTDEELRLKPYKDTEGKLTIGYGHNLDDLGITERTAEYILAEDLTNVLEELNDKLPWWKKISESHRRGLMNMAFNLGLPRLLKFEKMLRALRKGNGERAAAEAIDSKWAKQVGTRAWRVAALYHNRGEE